MAMQDLAKGRPLTNSPSRTCPCTPGPKTSSAFRRRDLLPGLLLNCLLRSRIHLSSELNELISYLRPLGLSLLPHQSIPLLTGPLLIELNTTIGYLEPLLKIPPLGQSLPFDMGLLLTDSLTDFVATNAPVMAIRDLTQRISTN